MHRKGCQNKKVQLKELQATYNGLKEFLNSCERIKPLGVDKERNTYWKFDCLGEYIIREKSSDVDMESLADKVPIETTWYKYNLSDKNEMNQLIQYLNSTNDSNATNLVSKIRKFMKEESVKPIDEFLIKNDTNKEEKKDEITIDGSEFIARRSSRIANKKPSNKVDGDDDPEIVNVPENSIFDIYNDLEPIDAGLRVNFLNRLILNRIKIFKIYRFSKILISEYLNLVLQNQLNIIRNGKIIIVML